MALASKRGVKNGKSDIYNNSLETLRRRNAPKKDFDFFQSNFETDDDGFNEQPINNITENKTIRITEQDLHNIIKESVNKILKAILK